MAEYRVHRARATDWREVREIRLRSLADAPDAFSTTLAEDQSRSDAEWRSRVDDAGAAHFLARAPQSVCVGLAVGSAFTDYTDTAGLFGMWVAPEARERGVGTALVQAVIAWARNENYKRIVLDVGDDNTAAMSLYAACGFSATGKSGSLPPPRQHIREHECALLLQPT